MVHDLVNCVGDATGINNIILLTPRCPLNAKPAYRQNQSGPLERRSDCFFRTKSLRVKQSDRLTEEKNINILKLNKKEIQTETLIKSKGLTMKGLHYGNKLNNY